MDVDITECVSILTEACASVQLTALVVWVSKTAISKRIDLTRYRVELFLDQSALRGAGSGAPRAVPSGAI